MSSNNPFVSMGNSIHATQHKSRSNIRRSNLFRLTIHFENRAKESNFKTTEIFYNILTREAAEEIIRVQENSVSKAFWNNQQIR